MCEYTISYKNSRRTGCGTLVRTELHQNRFQWRSLANTTMNLLSHKWRGRTYFQPDMLLATFQRRHRTIHTALNLNYDRTSWHSMSRARDPCEVTCWERERESTWVRDWPPPSLASAHASTHVCVNCCSKHPWGTHGRNMECITVRFVNYSEGN
jgi:hypothetical protein